MINTSVIICTHNPNPDYLRRTLEALKAQTLPKEIWELLLIDNASREPVSGKWDLSWHPQARHVREDELGLTAARLRGIRESASELVVFVDDDNLLAPDYLKQTLEIAERFPFLGAWGAGMIQPEFETAPPPWLRPYYYLIALKEVPQDRWSNLTDSDVTLPCGAGMCVRKPVLDRYAKSIESNLTRRKLGRIGSGLGCGEDLDIALTATDLGMGTGVFASLKMVHIMPAKRVSEEYLLKLAEGNHYSGVMLAASRGQMPSIPRLSGLRKLLGKLRRLLTMNPRSRRFLEAGMRGQQKAIRDIAA